MTDLDILVPATAEVTVAGETLVIRPLKVGQLPAFLRALFPISRHLSGPEIDWVSLLGRNGDDVLDAVSIASGKPRAWVDELAADEAVLLAAKLIEVNADFFARTVIPKLNGLFEQAGQIAPAAAGSTPSSG